MDTNKKDKEKMNKKFPVLDHEGLKEVPWRILIGHEQQAINNHNQTLERLADRGGLHPIEMASILCDRPYYKDVGLQGFRTHLSLNASLKIIEKHINQSCDPVKKRRVMCERVS